MQQALVSIWRWIASGQNRPFVWAVTLTTLWSLLGLLSPVDDALRSMRNHLHKHPGSGQVVVVTVDDQAIAAYGEWPWARTRIATLVNSLNAAGVKRIAFEHHFGQSDDFEGTRELAAAFEALPRKPLIGLHPNGQPADVDSSLPRPDQRLAARADLIDQALGFDGFGRAWLIDSEGGHGDTAVPTLAAALADHPNGQRQNYVIDYAIEAESIPQISAAMALEGGAKALLQDKRVIISTAPSMVAVPGSEFQRMAVLHAIATETILAGPQRDIGWLLPSLIGLFGAGFIWGAKRHWSILGFAGLVVLLGLIPAWLETHAIYGIYAHGLAFVMVTALVRFLRRRKPGSERTNALTGLPNLIALREVKLSPEALIIAVRVRNYRQLVATLPHHERALSMQIVQRLRAAGIGALYHGEEGIFGWIANASAADELTEHLDALHNLFLVPLQIEDKQVDVAIAFGIDKSNSTDASLRFASALVAADEAGAAGQRWRYCDPARVDETEWRMSLLGRLDAAIENGEVWVAFQAKYDLQHQCIIGAEALARWTHPDRGMISPDEFIPAAESNGRIDKLTYFVLDQSLILAKQMGPQFNVAVNLSAQMFGRREFVGRLRSKLLAHGVPARNLTLEVTESAAAQDEESMLSTLSALIELGVRISIDDYGTGYSTLEYLRKIRAHELKIDRRFVSAMENNNSDRLLVNATIQMAHSLGHKVVAEGVETGETAEMLRRMGCDAAQGYFLARPLPQSEFLEFAAAEKPCCVVGV